MKKDKILAIRVPEAVHSKLSSIAEDKGVTLTQLVKDSLSGLSWEFELERNVEYHKAVLRELKEIEKRLRATQRKRSKAVTGKAVPPKKREQLNML
jgi:hypothetical protein